MLYDSLFDVLDALDKGPISTNTNFPPTEIVEDKEGNVKITLALAGYTDDAIEILPGENKSLLKQKMITKRLNFQKVQNFLEHQALNEVHLKHRLLFQKPSIILQKLLLKETLVN